MWVDVHVMALDDRLVLIDPNEQDPKATALTLRPTDDRADTFVIADGPDKQILGETLVFEFSPDGRTVTGAVLNSAKWVRLQ
jgi:hypothetical protein